MPNFDREFFSIGYLDTLSYKQTVIHRLDPVSKLVVTCAFILTVVSFSKYELSRVLPFFIFPVVVISAGDIPVRIILKKVLVVSPFVLFAGMFNPVFDTEVAYTIAGIAVSKGWLSYASMIIKFVLTISAALLLIATTSFPGICFALERLRVPRVFVMQLLFVYRYLFVLAEEAMRIIRARNMRSFGEGGTDMRTFTNIVGTFLLRSMERSERIYHAVCSRGFDGRIRLMREFRFGLGDAVFILASLSVFIVLRMYDIAAMIGDAALK